MFDLIALFSFFILCSLGVYLIYKSQGRFVNIVAGFWLFSAGAWSLGQVFMIWSTDLNSLYWSIGIAHLGVFMLGATTIHFALIYPFKRKIMNKNFMPFIFYIVPIIFYFCFLTNNFHGLFYKNLAFDPGWVLNFNKTFGIIGITSVFVTYVFVSIGVILFFNSIFKVSGKKRTGSFLLFLGVSLGLFSSILGEFKITPQTMFFPFSGILFTVAVLRYRAIDITPAVVAEKILDTIMDFLFLTDEKGTIKRVNKSVKNVLGFSEENMKEKKIYSFFKNKDGFFDTIDFIDSKDINYLEGLECVILDSDKIEHSVSINASSVFGDKGELMGYIFSLRDITDKKNAEYNLKKSRDELFRINKELENRNCEVEQLLEQKNDFIDLLAHDLKNPLTTPLITLPIIKEKIDESKYKEMINLSYKNIKKIKELIEQTLELAHLEDTRKNVNIKELNLFELLENVLDENKTLLSDNGFSVSKNINKNLKISADEFQIKEVFSNIIFNSVKYTPEDVLGKIDINAFEENNLVKISISDNGAGIDSDTKKHVFEKFYKKGKARRDMNSTGLGLSLCKKIVEKHGGKIWVESPGLGKGSTFYFTLKKADRVKEGN